MNTLLTYFGKPKFNLVDIISVAIATNLFSSEYYLAGLLVLVFGAVFSCFIQFLWETK